MKKDAILCFGEIVWDALPAGIFLGGAPLNVAYHLTRLGHRAFPVSRIGRDFLGEETLRRLKRGGVSTNLIQEDREHHTGAVVISLDESGDATYEIREPAAWDFIEPSGDLMEQAGTAAALVYGTLATRSPGNARLLEQLLEAVPVSVCDVNLRKPYDDIENALLWAGKASLIKLNEEELARLVPDAAGDIGRQAGALAEKAGVKTIVVTRGGDGALVWHEGNCSEKPSPDVDVADTVGAGDAFTAGFLSHYLKGADMETALEKALLLGGFVAGRSGAQPDYAAGDVLG